LSISLSRGPEHDLQPGHNQKTRNPFANKMTLTTKIVLALIVLHLLVGFGWLLYKLLPPGSGQADQKDREDGTKNEPKTDAHEKNIS
jgi:hypothetical protein